MLMKLIHKQSYEAVWRLTEAEPVFTYNCGLTLRREECELSGAVEGVTALHVAAAISDEGFMAQLLQNRCRKAKGMWQSWRNEQGSAPADIAYL